MYGYEFDERAAPAPEPLRTVPFPVGASHTLELRYLFDVGGTSPLNPVQQKLSDEMIDFWSGFVSTGVPHAHGTPEWPVFDGERGPWMSLQAFEVRTSTQFYDDHQCGFWAGR